MDSFSGYLLARLHRIGSKSEGPEYALQLPTYEELHVIKKASLWENDPKLHALLGRKVIIDGEPLIEGIAYTDAKPLPIVKGGATAAAATPSLTVLLGVEPQVLWIDKQPGGGQPSTSPLELDLSVQWPYRSIWTGRCPTSQLYDFWIEKDGKTIWQWSQELCGPPHNKCYAESRIMRSTAVGPT